jgi:hypothetical protein
MSNKTWYVEATGHTNEVIAGKLSVQDAQQNILCIDGRKRELWECKYSLITNLKKNRSSGQLVFTVWYRVGRYGPVRKWPFLKKQKLTLASALKKGLVTVTNQREGP